jgi:hypothetical protein
MVVNKKVIIGIVIAIVIGIGSIVLAQVNQDDKIDISDTPSVQTSPQRFTVGLQESVGVSEIP